MVTIDDILAFDGNMNINFYVKLDKEQDEITFEDAFDNWLESGKVLKDSMHNLFDILDK